MVETIVVMKNGYAYMLCTSSFEELMQRIRPNEAYIAQVSSRVIRACDIRQGKEARPCPTVS